jgi:hypothetical protein
MAEDEEERGSDAGSSFDGTVEAEEALEVEVERIQGRRKAPGREWIDWEDLILEDTVPLVGFVRMILHSGKYTTFPLSPPCASTTSTRNSSRSFTFRLNFLVGRSMWVVSHLDSFFILPMCSFR